MNKKCINCRLVNHLRAQICIRCGAELSGGNHQVQRQTSLGATIAKRVAVLVVVCIGVLLGFYASLIFSATPLTREQSKSVADAVNLLDKAGFEDEVFLLRRLAVFRSNDNWLNASVEKESAFAATNFPVEIVTLYPDFFTYPVDDVERAAILLHEAKHLQGEGEKEAYEFVWKNRKRLGWTRDKYAMSEVWQNVRRQTRDQAPNLFVCDFNNFGDCTE